MTQITTISKFALLDSISANTNIHVIAKVVDICDITTYQPEVNYCTSVQITDGSKTLAFNIWKPIEEVEMYLRVDGVYKIYAQVRQFRGKPSLKYLGREEVEDDAVLRRFDLSSFRGLTPENYKYFIESVRKIEDFRMRRLVEVCYGLGACPKHIDQKAYQRRWDKQVSGFGSIRRHDDYPGGIINHIAGMLRVIDSLEGIYGNRKKSPTARLEKMCEVNWDLVRVLVYLHDLGKQDTYVKTLNNRVVFRDGAKLGHEQIGVVLVSKYLRDLEPEYLLTFAEEQNVLNGIATHHVPGFDKSIEERLLSSIDNIDAACVDCLTV